MATASERIPVLVTAVEKGRIAKQAKAAGLSMGEFLRRAAVSFRPADDEQVLEKMIDQMVKSTSDANAALDEALAFVEASNKRIRNLEMRAKGKGGVVGVTDKMWDAVTTVIKMNDKVERMASMMKLQQEKIENLTERVIRLETALEIALSRAGGGRSTSRRLERKE